MKNLRLLRERAQLSQADLAKMVHVSQQAICKYELGGSEAGYHTLTEMSNIFNVPIECLVNDDIDIEQYNTEKALILTRKEEEFILALRNMDSSSRTLVYEMCKKLRRDRKKC